MKLLIHEVYKKLCRKFSAAERLIQDAECAMSQRKFEEALVRWAAVREKFPHHHAGYTRAAAAYMELKDFQQAEALCRQGIEQAPAAIEPLIQYAECAMSQRKFEEALVRWTAVREKFPHHHAGYTRAAAAYMEIKDFQQAEALCQQGSKQAPAAIEPLSQYVECAMQQRLFAEACSRWQSLQKKFPDNTESLEQIALAYINIKDYQQAAQYCLKGLKQNKQLKNYMQPLSILLKEKYYLEDIFSLLFKEKLFLLSPENYELSFEIYYANRDMFTRLPIKFLRKILNDKNDYKVAIAIRNKLKLKYTVAESLLKNIDYKHCTSLLLMMLIDSFFRAAQCRYNESLFELLEDIIENPSCMQEKLLGYQIIFSVLENQKKWDILHKYLSSYKNSHHYDEKTYALYIAKVYISTYDGNKALHFIKRDCLDFTKYPINTTLSMYTELAKLFCSSENLNNMLAMHMAEIGTDKKSASLYCFLSLASYTNTDINIILQKNIDILCNSVEYHITCKRNQSVSLLKTLVNHFCNRLNKELSILFYKKISSFIKIKSPYYLEKKKVLPIFHKGKKNIALLFSGFIRNYDYAANIINIIQKTKNYNIFTFYYLFDKLGNIRIDSSMPPKIYTYTHGGLYTEIQKTQDISVERLQHEFMPTCYEIVKRETDDFYLDTIGITHPQWLLVYHSYILAERYAQEHGITFDFIARARMDNFPRDTACLEKACSDLEQLPEQDILVMQRHSYGAFNLSDRFAIGRPQALKTYCSIGKDKNFVSVEETSFWKENIKQPYHKVGGSHETHLGMWLKLHNINFHKKSYLD